MAKASRRFAVVMSQYGCLPATLLACSAPPRLHPPRRAWPGQAFYFGDLLDVFRIFLVIACGVLALVYGWFTSRQVLTANAGTARMQEISGAVQVGARAYLNRQYRTIAIVGVVVLIVLGVDPRAARRDRLCDRRGAVGGGRLYRDECLGARQCEDRPGGAQRPRCRAGDRVQGRRGHRLAGCRARPPGGRDLLLHPAGDRCPATICARCWKRWSR